jgi:hypothetical protein
MNDEQHRLFIGIVNAFGLTVAFIICTWAFWRWL